MVKRRALAKPPNIKPIVIGLFSLTATGMEVRGRPSLVEYEAVGEFIKRAHRAAGFWLGDWLRYGDSREDWRERLSQVQDATGLSEKTCKNVRAIAAIDPSRRRDGVEFSIHAEVASMPPEEQSIWLDRAESEGWTQRELRLEIRASKRRAIIDGQAVLEGMYRVIYADPPWSYSDHGSPGSDSLTAYARVDGHYPTLSIEDICKLPVAAHSMPNSVLFLWVTAPLLLQQPGPREVIEAWGFTAKTGMVWDKVLGNFGHYVHACHEHLIIATRGSGLPDRPTPQPDSVQTIRRSDTHSQKPEEFRQIIEKLYDGPYLELFARSRVPGWSCMGNDARLWAQEAGEQVVGV